MNEKVKEWFKSIAGYGVVLLVSVAYVATSFIMIRRSYKTLWEIIVDGALVFVVGVLISRAFELQGMMEGDRDPELKEEESKHAKLVDQVAPVIDDLEEWCTARNRDALRTQRIRILAQCGLKYSDYFDEEGMTRPFEVNEKQMKNRYTRKIEKKRIRCYLKALSVRLTPLSAAVLTGESGRHWDPYFLGRSKSDYTKESGKLDIVIKIVMSLSFGYFGVSLVADRSLAGLIWKVFQIAVFLSMGNQKQIQAREFVAGEFKGRMNKKRKYLQMFVDWEKERSQSAEQEDQHVGDTKQ